MPSLHKHIRRALAKQTGLLPPRFVVFEAPLRGAPAPAALHQLRRPSALMTLDLEDPTPLWPAAVTRQLRWVSLQQLADLHPPLERALRGVRAKLSAPQAASSPRLGPAIVALEPALGHLEQRRRSWRRQGADDVALRLRAFTNGLWVWLELEVNAAALARWPTLAEWPGAEAREGLRWALRLPLRPPEAVALAARLLRDQSAPA